MGRGIVTFGNKRRKFGNRVQVFSSPVFHVNSGGFPLTITMAIIWSDSRRFALSVIFKERNDKERNDCMCRTNDSRYRCEHNSVVSKKLCVVEGPDAGRTIDLVDGTTVSIGRGQASGERLHDPRVSRVHCKLDVTAQGTTLIDENSTGGTFIAGRKITRHRLSNGDEIQLGETRIRYESESETVSDQKASQPARVSAKSLQELIGQSLGHFKIESIRHTGAASVLFKATDTKHQRPAIVKVMLPTVMSDDDQRNRFVRAVHTMINVRHENLVEVYGAGKQGPFCWCAMEFVDGISILEIIELVGTQGRLDWRDVYRVAVHVARALGVCPPAQGDSSQCDTGQPSATQERQGRQAVRFDVSESLGRNPGASGHRTGAAGGQYRLHVSGTNGRHRQSGLAFRPVRDWARRCSHCSRVTRRLKAPRWQNWCRR